MSASAPRPPFGFDPSAGAAPGTAVGPLRHPLDPQERVSTKAGAVLALGLTALLLMCCGGGLVPAACALLLARPAREELRASRGFLTGERALGVGVACSWVALITSVTILIVVVLAFLFRVVEPGGPRYDENVD